MAGTLDQGGQGPPGGVDGAVGVEQERPQAPGGRVGQARVDEDVEAARLPDEVGVGHHDPVLLKVGCRQVGTGPVAEVVSVADDAGPVALGGGGDDVVLGPVVRDDDDEPARRGRGQGGQEAIELLAGIEGHGDDSHALLIGRAGSRDAGRAQVRLTVRLADSTNLGSRCPHLAGGTGLGAGGALYRIHGARVGTRDTGWRRFHNIGHGKSLAL